MKLRLKQPHYENFTGQMGTVFFENGLSTTDVRPNDAVRMASQFLCEWEDGTTASVAQSLLDHSHATVHTIGVPQNADQALRAEAEHSAKLAGVEVQPDGKPAQGQRYTEDELAAIADKDGIKGLRAIGDKLGVKAHSVAELIRAILAKQE